MLIVLQQDVCKVCETGDVEEKRGGGEIAL
jgi:hypothetical protein